jgi:hypothetical protein
MRRGVVDCPTSSWRVPTQRKRTGTAGIAAFDRNAGGGATICLRRRQTEFDGNFSDYRGARYYLEDARKAFEDWRYLHEKVFLLASHEELTAIAVALHKTVRDRWPELVSVFEA